MFLCVFSFIFNAYAWQPPELKGELTQGALIVGKTQAGTELWLNDKVLRVSSNGDFVFGFGRDAKLTHKLSWKLPNQSNIESTEIVLKKRQYDIERIEGVANKYVNPPKNVLERIRQDNKNVKSARSTDSNLRYFTQNFLMPAQGRISGVYGSQRIFNGVPKRPHFGIDIANKTGTPVIAPAGGVVTLVDEDMYYSGGTLIIDHGYGVSSTFIHLNKIHVKEGQTIEQGQLIADIGATGRVTGPHLDWRINWFNERLDPGLLVNLN